MPLVSRALLLASLGVLAPASAAPAEPMHLSDPRPRWVLVRFEASPEDQPGRLDGRYGEALPAWLEPDRLPGRMRVTVPARLVESRLLADQGARPGALSDFSWIFDAQTGDVVSASLSGRLVRRVRVGFLGFDAEVEIRTELTTLAPAGFEPAETILSQRFFAYCNPLEETACTGVPAVPYDAQTGYVNAVGFVSGRSAGLTTRSFSPLGEARFSELDAATPESVEWAAAAGLPAVGAPPPVPAAAAAPSPPGR